MLSVVLIVLIFIFGRLDANIAHGKHVIVNGSLEKIQLTANNETIKEEQVKKVNLPPIVEVIHGKVNSVIHEIRGSIDDIPQLLNDIKPKEEVVSPTHLKQSTDTYELTESENGGASGVETVLDEVLLTRAASDLIENSSSSILVSRSGGGSAALQPEPPTLPAEDLSKQPTPQAPVNGTKDDQPHDDIPSFSEWAKKQMAEAEKNKGENLTVGTVKVRLKNYASPDCGAKVVASNPEAGSPGAILSPSRDDYMLNACTDKIWFVVELCEAIQPQRIEVANFELFSSSPKEFTISVSDRFPTREWSLVGTIIAKDERTVQTFPLPQLSHFAKYVKVELLSHYGTEHFCPISLFKAFGTSELEVLDNVDNDEDDSENSEDSTISEPYDEDDIPLGHVDQIARGMATSHMNNIGNGDNGNSGGSTATTTASNEPTTTEGDQKPGNLLGTAKAAVLSIVKKAAEVLVVNGNENNATCNGDNITDSKTLSNRHCVTPAYLIVCTNCTDDFYNRVYEYLSCSLDDMELMLTNSFVNRILLNTRLCTEIGLNWGLAPPQIPPFRGRNSHKDPQTLAIDYLRTFLYPETIAALCNFLAITERKVLLNTSQTIIESEELPTTPELTLLPEPEKQEISTEDIDDDVLNIEELKTVDPAPEKTMADSISPTKTLPIVNNEMSLEVNDTRPVDEQQQSAPPPIVENTTVPDQLVEVTKSTPTPSVTSSMPIAPLSEQPSPVTLVTEEDKTDVNETEETESQITTPEVQPTEPVVPMVQDEVDPLTLASLFPELDDEGATEPAATKTTSQTPSTQKESVFVRLANRIKALEMNMSLSGQYLEELSRRYKKQVEELQRTLSNLIEERRQAAERETLQAAQITSLTVKMDALTLALSELLSERDKVSMIGQHGVIIVVEVVVFLVVLAICRWLGAAKTMNSPNDRRVNTSQHLRRHSMDNVDGPSAPKIRRPSEEACLPAVKQSSFKKIVSAVLEKFTKSIIINGVRWYFLLVDFNRKFDVTSKSCIVHNEKRKGTTHKELLVDGVKRKTSREGTRRRKRRRKDRWEDEGIVLIGPDGEEILTTSSSTAAGGTTTSIGLGNRWEPTASSIHHQHHQDYTVRTAMWSRAKRTSAHTQTSSSQETLCSLPPTQQQNNNNSTKTISTTTTTSSTATATSSSSSSTSKTKKSSGAAIKKIVKKFF